MFHLKCVQCEWHTIRKKHQLTTGIHTDWSDIRENVSYKKRHGLNNMQRWSLKWPKRQKKSRKPVFKLSTRWLLLFFIQLLFSVLCIQFAYRRVGFSVALYLSFFTICDGITQTTDHSIWKCAWQLTHFRPHVVVPLHFADRYLCLQTI